jgi:hypothetical protein
VCVRFLWKSVLGIEVVQYDIEVYLHFTLSSTHLCLESTVLDRAGPIPGVVRSCCSVCTHPTLETSGIGVTICAEI